MRSRGLLYVGMLAAPPLTVSVASAASLPFDAAPLTASTAVVASCVGAANVDGYEVTNPPPSTCTLKDVSDDSYVRQDSANSNYGSEREIFVKSYSGNRNFRSFLRVNVAGSCEESGQPIPAGAGTISATLYLYISAAPGASRTYEIHRVTEAWTEGSITWNNQPAVAGSATSSTTTGTAPARGRRSPSPKTSRRSSPARATTAGGSLTAPRAAARASANVNTNYNGSYVEVSSGPGSSRQRGVRRVGRLQRQAAQAGDHLPAVTAGRAVRRGRGFRQAVC